MRLIFALLIAIIGPRAFALFPVVNPLAPQNGAAVLPPDEEIGIEGLQMLEKVEGVDPDQAFFTPVSINPNKPHVFVDISTQTMKITAPEFGDGAVLRAISTGGGVKHPKNPITKEDAPAACADLKTPTNINALWIPAKEDSSDPNRTMFYDDKISTIYDSLMRRAIRVVGHAGIYLHEVPAGNVRPGVKYSDLLGDNVSGGCVRMDAEIADWLFLEMRHYEGIYLTIQGRLSEAQRKCKTDEYGRVMVKNKKGEYILYKDPRPNAPPSGHAPGQGTQDLPQTEPRVSRPAPPRTAPPAHPRPTQSEDPLTKFFKGLFGG